MALDGAGPLFSAMLPVVGQLGFRFYYGEFWSLLSRSSSDQSGSETANPEIHIA
jgi:hypothetical protein